ncbi:MAG: CoB--CoM heterodisulfide reductase iron-sulfur subunit A family protein [Desulfomonilia bacterium]
MEHSRPMRCILCRCHGEIGDVIDLDTVIRDLQDDPAGVSCDVRDSLCLDENIDELSEDLAASGAPDIVLGACSFYARGDRILTGFHQRGVSPQRVELVDIREGCSWIHRETPSEATIKATDLMRMGIALHRARHIHDDIAVQPHESVLVIGAGPAGSTAAARLAHLGVKVHLLDRAKSPGGLLNLIKRIAPEDSSAEEFREHNRILTESDLLTYYPGSKLISVQGSAGDFTVKVSSANTEHTIHAGAIILATGAKIMMPDGLYRHGKLTGVLSGIELERRLKADQAEGTRVVFIQCVGVRDHQRPYCSAICCLVSLKQACQILELNPEAEVFILHRDIMCPGSVLEGYYRRAMAKGVRLLRYDEDRPPEILGEEQVDSVEVYDVLTSEVRRLPADLVVLSTPLAPHDDAGRIAQLFGLEVDGYGFYKVRDLMHPLETKRAGICVCGSARWPVLGRTAMAQGEAAAMKAYDLIRGGTIMASGLSQYREHKFSLAHVDQAACTGCGNCVAVCPYDACSLEIRDRAYKSVVDLIRCSGCGSCVSVCPNGSIQLPGQNAAAVSEMLRAAFERGG